ncbi:tail fiber domain-containing protein [Enterobacter asburiae]
MTVSTVVDHNDYTGNGVTTSFPYTFRIFKKSDLAVSVLDLSGNLSVLVLDTDYTVTNAGGYSGGNVVLTTPLANGWQISIARDLAPTQETDLRNQGKFFAEVHEDALDKLTMLIQQVSSLFRLALRKPSSIANWYDALNNYIRNVKDPRDPQDAATKNYVDVVSTTNLNRTLRTPEAIPQLPGIEQRKNKIVGFDASGNPIMLVPTSGSAADVLLTLGQPGGAGYIADIAKPITWYGGVSGQDCSSALNLALQSGLPFFFPEGTWIVNQKITFTGSFQMFGVGNAIIKSDKMFEFTDANNSVISDLVFQTISVPYTIKRNTTTWNATVSDVRQSRDGYQPTALDTDIWASLSQSIKDQAINRTIECGAKFFSSTSSGIDNVNILRISGLGVAFELYGAKNSVASNCSITGNSRDAITFINDTVFNSVTLPRGTGNRALNNNVTYASQCGVCWWGQDEFLCDGNNTQYCGESGIKIYQYDTNHPVSIISKGSRIVNNFSAYNYYDGIDAQVWYPPATDPGVLARNVIKNNTSIGSRHTGITSNGGQESVTGNNCRSTGATGLRIVSSRSIIEANIATDCANAASQHPFQIFGMSIQGDGIVSIGNRVNNSSAPAYTYDYLHTGLNGSDPASGDPGLDFGNTCNSGLAVMFISKNITSSMSDFLVGTASKTNTLNAAVIVRKSGYGVDLCGGNGEGSANLRGDITSGASLNFQPVSEDPATLSPKASVRYSFSAKKLIFSTERAAKVEIGDTAGMYPTADNNIGLGLPSNRWTAVYAVNGSIVTSDGRLKCDIRNLSEAELATAKSLKNMIKAYKFIDSVENKGTDARIHFGVIAQEVIDAFNANGLDALNYGIVCYDEWDYKPELKDASGNIITPEIKAGNRYGIRYDELLCFIVSAL